MASLSEAPVQIDNQDRNKIILSQSRDITQEMETKRYAIVRANEFSLNTDLIQDLADLKKEWNLLGPDPYYLGAGGAFRQRAYSDFDYTPALKSLTRRDYVPYYQSIEQNRVVGGIHRRFTEIREDAFNNRMFRAMVDFDFSVLPVEEKVRNLRWVCQVHMIRINVPAGAETQIAPEGIHSDGYPFAGVHLIARHNVEGGLSTVYSWDECALASLTFEDALDSLLIEDRHMKHGVSPIRSVCHPGGYRDLLAISFSLPGSDYETIV